ncbi:MAG TPA: hypothetical protein VNF29_00610 [Candidatus Binataceae bacterium]|nr:hypothetical protein [Candidatus Binataceae bacterium]
MPLNAKCTDFCGLKGQQHTLSVRISDAPRRRLENAREMFGWADGNSMVMSEVAKRFMESAQDDYIKPSELMGCPTETLLKLRGKWERGQSISRAEGQVFRLLSAGRLRVTGRRPAGTQPGNDGVARVGRDP